MIWLFEFLLYMFHEHGLVMVLIAIGIALVVAPVSNHFDYKRDCKQLGKVMADRIWKI